jgi:acetyltransferase-like isoleucine patch superfamily enzyme
MVKVVWMRARSRGRLQVARSVRAGRGARVHVAPGARVHLGDSVRLGPDSRIEAVAGVVRVGAGSAIGERAVIVAHESVEIGPRVAIGDWAALADGAPTYDDVERPVRTQPLRTAPIRVGEGAVVGPHASLGPGATVTAGEEVPAYAVLPAPPPAPRKPRGGTPGAAGEPRGGKRRTPGGEAPRSAPRRGGGR